MPRFALETTTPKREPCSCCGRSVVFVTGFLTEASAAVGFYFARFVNGHEDQSFDLAICIGDVAGSGPRTTFVMKAREQGVSLVDGLSSPWAGNAMLGRMLSRAKALAHPDRAMVFELSDVIIPGDPALRSYRARCNCGDSAVPLELGFSLPDDVFALSESERTRRAKIGKAFVELDGTRFFVRTLVPMPVETIGTWNIGLWLELTASDSRRLKEVWTSDGFVGHRFEGTTANELSEPTLSRGTRVEASGVDSEQLPHVVSSSDHRVEQLLNRRWPWGEFERFAARHHYL